jgi:hypothetical protein
MSTGRKVFHCAVDETALTTNITEIKKWTTNGAIDLIVPLYSRYFDTRGAECFPTLLVAGSWLI